MVTPLEQTSDLPAFDKKIEAFVTLLHWLNLKDILRTSKARPYCTAEFHHRSWENITFNVNLGFIPLVNRYTR